MKDLITPDIKDELEYPVEGIVGPDPQGLTGDYLPKASGGFPLRVIMIDSMSAYSSLILEPKHRIIEHDEPDPAESDVVQSGPAKPKASRLFLSLLERAVPTPESPLPFGFTFHEHSN